MRSVHISIYGTVQGVNYREWARSSCLKLSIFGWIRNSSDGSLECFLQGDEDNINNFLINCWDGSPNSEVDDILEKEGLLDTELDDFIIL